MHIILGGAYNGKRAYVESQLATLSEKELVVCEGKLPELEEVTGNTRVLITDFEQIILPYLEEPEDMVAARIFAQIADIAERAEVFCICTDTSRGVVPIEREARQLRDTCGRLYQKLCQEAKTVIRVWYGIPQFLKGEQHG